MELSNGKHRRFKVTRRSPELAVAETKMFRSRSKAKRQLEEWLQ
jgi:hypothetical protein